MSYIQPATPMKPMQVSVVKIIQVRFMPIGNFIHPDATKSLHLYGTIQNIATGEDMGLALMTHTGRYRDSYSINAKDLAHVTLPGSKLKYICFRNYAVVPNEEYAVDV